MRFEMITVIHIRLNITISSHQPELLSHISNCLLKYQPVRLTVTRESTENQQRIKSKLIFIPPQTSSLLNSPTQFMAPYPAIMHHSFATLLKC